MVDNDLNQIIDFPTSATGILDHIFISKDLEVTPSRLDGNQMNSLSNHCSFLPETKIQNFQSVHFRPGKPTASFSCSNGVSDRPNSLIAQKPFPVICWSNVNAPIEQWYVWIEFLVFQKVSRKEKHRTHLSLWVISSTSQLIKRLKTAIGNQPNNHTKVRCLQKFSADNLQWGHAIFETKLSDTKSMDQFSSFFNLQINSYSYFKLLQKWNCE